MKKVFSVIQPNLDYCYITNNPNVAIHHIFGGANRDRSGRYGFILALRPDWHNMSDYGVHFNKTLDLKFKGIAQKYYESNIGTREQFIKEFGRSYLYE